jgi:hypothetical protein
MRQDARSRTLRFQEGDLVAKAGKPLTWLLEMILVEKLDGGTYPIGVLCLPDRAVATLPKRLCALKHPLPELLIRRKFLVLGHSSPSNPRWLISLSA